MGFKRAIDMVVSAAALILGLPILVLIAVAILLESGPPVFYSQRRIGLGLRAFRLYKFRSMAAGSDGPTITVRGDPRVTRLGRFIRATKLDELPQFWNVLRGDMSLVGPRPEVPEYVELFRKRYEVVLSLRPGITDLASLRFHDEETLLAAASDPISEYVKTVLPAKLDLAEQYVSRRTLSMDMSILWQTALLMLRFADAAPERMVARGVARFERMRRIHRPLVWLAQFTAFAACGVAAFLLRFEFWVPSSELNHLAWALSVWLLVKTVVFRMARLDRSWWRFVSVRDAIGIGIGNLAASLISAVAISALGPPGFPRSVFLLDFLLCFMAVAGLRVAIRIAVETAAAGNKTGSPRRTLIYGAGGAGFTLIQEIRRNPNLCYAVVGFVDDNPSKAGLSIQGAKVLGSGEHLSKLVPEYGIELVLIAIPTASGTEMSQILHRCHQAGVSHKTVPGLGELIENNSLVHQIRDVAVEDLLGRTPVRLDRDLIRARYEDRVVLVTGAGGSIGSELCRQIARFGPRSIVGFDIAETALFHLELEMRDRFSAVPFFPVVGSIQDAGRLEQILRQYSPFAVFHAAAYKHVPMMEAHVFEAVKNNVFGTLNVATLAARHGVEDFLMISSDKAVNPTSIMGVTKRVAEIAVAALQGSRTKHVSVRFGNVLGSNGSVVPIFKQQIAAGGPVMITHPEMRRYFMTIPEAVQLVLQASTMGKGGEIFVLEMGEPVRIVDLARNLIVLSGLRPDEDVKIEFSGIRPGEKLFEQVNSPYEETLPTPHEKIKVFAGDRFAAGDIRDHLEQLSEICTAGDVGALILKLKDLVPEYSPSGYVLRRVVEEARKPASLAAAS